MYEKHLADVAFLEGRYEDAAKMYLEGARDGDGYASFSYGYCLWRGRGVNYDPTEAKSFFTFARDVGEGEASYNIAMLYLHGEGVKKDYKKAFEHMCVSAEQGCVEAQLYLGMAYTAGCMYEPDVTGISMIPCHTPEYLSDAFLLSGDVDDFERDEDLRYSAVKQDANLAFSWFQRASRHDPQYVDELVAKGKFLYAKCFADGFGTDFDRAKSTHLMFLAERAGSPEAHAYIIENGLNAEMLANTKKQRLK